MMDSFINVATIEKQMHLNGTYTDTQSLATLNTVSNCLNNVDLITKLTEKEEQEHQMLLNQFVSRIYTIYPI